MTIKLFGYVIGIESRKKIQARTLSKPACKVTSDGKYLFLTTPTGEVLPHQLSCTIIEEVHSMPRARIELYVDLTEIIKIKDNPQ